MERAEKKSRMKSQTCREKGIVLAIPQFHTAHGKSAIFIGSGARVCQLIGVSGSEIYNIQLSVRPVSKQAELYAESNNRFLQSGS